MGRTRRTLNEVGLEGVPEKSVRLVWTFEQFLEHVDAFCADEGEIILPFRLKLSWYTLGEIHEDWVWFSLTCCQSNFLPE